MTREQTAIELERAQDIAYQAFQRKLIPGIDHILGVRMPVLRTLARQIVKGDWRAWLDDSTPDHWYEETMLRGIVTATAPMEWEERCMRTDTFVPLIDNWAVCDSVCGSFCLQDRQAWWQFLQPYLSSEREFFARFGAVMLLHLLVGQDDLPRTLYALVHVPARGYAARMGVAWALSECGVRYPKETLCFLREQDKLDAWTYIKALQKMLESRRLPDAWRTAVREQKQIKKSEGSKGESPEGYTF